MRILKQQSTRVYKRKDTQQNKISNFLYNISLLSPNNGRQIGRVCCWRHCENIRARFVKRQIERATECDQLLMLQRRPRNAFERVDVNENDALEPRFARRQISTQSRGVGQQQNVGAHIEHDKRLWRQLFSLFRICVRNLVIDSF